tara:strand:+ start:122 stop:427 length:306 start_codon:yes stop_codon:yes gene_type:complete
MEVDFQFFFNTIAGIITFFGGFLLKTFWARLDEIDKEREELWMHHEDDMKLLRKDLSTLALTLPEKYTTKDDFHNLVKTVHHRFDKLEEKIDDLNSKQSNG